MAGNLQVNGVDLDNYYIPANNSVIGYTDRLLFGWGDNYFNNVVPDGSSGNLPYFGSSKSSPIQIGTTTVWALISLSNSTSWTNNYAVGPAYGPHSGGIKSNGTLWMWGSNYNGQLGFPRGGTDIRGSTVRTPVQVGALTNWSKLACGAGSTLAVKTDGTLWSWGYNGNGALGLGDVVHRSSPVQVGAGTTWSNVFCTSGGTGGAGASFAIKTDGTLWSWGYNGSGQLGLGDTTSRSSPVQVGALTTWSTVAGRTSYNDFQTSGYHAIKTDGTLWGWGIGNSLGEGTTTRSSPIQIGTSTNWNSVYGGGTGAMALKAGL
jgi:hypothetical protein